MATEVSEQDFIGTLRVVCGHSDPGKLSLFSVVRNEMFFLPAFFDHYRRLGVDRFFILDDGSSDGTADFLSQQEDCVLLTSRFSFGQRIVVKWSRGGIKGGRAGPLLKRAIAERFLRGRWAIYADPDEFLLVPDRVSDVITLCANLDRSGIRSLFAAMVDFYPETIAKLKNPCEAENFRELVTAYGYFDATDFFGYTKDHRPKLCAETASSRLFRTHGLRDVPPALRWLPTSFKKSGIFPAPPTPAWYKTPILKWEDDNWMVGSHKSHIRAPETPRLATAHFRFTADTFRRVESARIKRSYSHNSAKYDRYHELIRRMQETGAPFIAGCSRSYRAPSDLEETGLIRCAQSQEQ